MSGCVEHAAGSRVGRLWVGGLGVAPVGSWAGVRSGGAMRPGPSETDCPGSAVLTGDGCSRRGLAVVPRGVTRLQLARRKGQLTYSRTHACQCHYTCYSHYTTPLIRIS